MSALRLGALAALLAFAACDEEEAVPSGAAAAAEHRGGAPPCARDEDCVVVDVFCGGRSVEHRSVAEEVRARYGEEAAVSNCARSPWAPPERLQAYCAPSHYCAMDEIVWPGFRACEPEDACAALLDPCRGWIAVRADRLEEARATIASEERGERCGDRGARLAGDRGADEAAPACVRGYCQ
ncbi:MAG TPA: hypothetical protein RMH85_06635 [Polyangiaceae bacterium LLY-WYZ-15_(1-7)]|nr:hypothetical protein [Sandaracinus sp.]HJK93048.1 hypothetical protein [Polyangiaceae bacterium LLY-WYZ-15_(1-7)]MBJ75172.1 hypothetical protein [Sandaracinus sp.]HJL03757.1 hypothetical protein [Polyangiaceae bacterium LLY-WYZ-15_(1-7)]HJL08153.1 hypothetical protein [Polyangiaceae bacterium LLY-WYZ-15_(1-7)]